LPDPRMSAEIDALFNQRMAYLAGRLTSGEITLGEWQIEMREAIRRARALQLIAGADGDRSKVSADDWLKLGPALRKQDGFLREFARDIQAGKIAPTAIADRATLYAGTAGEAYWQQATKDVDLPAMPRDGSSPCGGRCGCSWVESGGEWYWELGKTDSCPVCVQRASEWSPYQS
jgi:hypothetical protein